MATVSEFEKLTVKERRQRYFSEDLKRKLVSQIDRNLLTISEVCREYQVSATAVYQWIYKFSMTRKKQQRQVVEAESDTRKLNLLKEELMELQRVIGEKQLKIDFLEKMVELAEQEYGVDIKKKYGTKPFSGTGKTAKNTPTA